MVDSILDLYYGEHDLKQIKKLEYRCLLSNNSRYIFLFSYYFQNDGIDKEKLENSLIELNSLRYLRFYIRSVKCYDFDKIFDKIISFENAKEIYYTIYDVNDIDDKYILIALKKLIDLNEKKYLFLLFYYYFIILKRYNENVIILFNSCFGNDITDICTYMESKKDGVLGSIDISKYREYTSNCYIGHSGFIPDIIVCHICNNYEHAIENFYDNDLEVSSHFVIGRDGRVKQVVDLHDSAWGNGTSLNMDSDVYYKFSDNSLVKNRNYNANYYTFSIEHESFDGTLTEKQYKSSLNVIKKIIKFIKDEYNYEFIIDREHIVGHRDINPIVRTVCPGNSFPFDRLINDLKK